MDEKLFPEEALVFLEKARFDENAVRILELMTMSFHWSDERLREAGRLCRSHGSLAHFHAMEFRTSLIRGRPIEEFRATWDQLFAACPDWPGFRPERCNTDLLAEWQRERRRACAGLERDLRQLEAAQD